MAKYLEEVIVKADDPDSGSAGLLAKAKQSVKKQQEAMDKFEKVARKKCLDWGIQDQGDSVQKVVENVCTEACNEKDDSLDGCVARLEPFYTKDLEGFMASREDLSTKEVKREEQYLTSEVYTEMVAGVESKPEDGGNFAELVQSKSVNKLLKGPGLPKKDVATLAQELSKVASDPFFQKPANKAALDELSSTVEKYFTQTTPEKLMDKVRERARAFKKRIGIQRNLVMRAITMT